MDSRELFDIINPFDRTQADGLMTRILQWVGRAVPPEYVYMQGQMNAWAMRNGWRQGGNDEELCALLKRTQQYVVRGTSLSVEINDALVARRSING
jgi:hypothetical protein